MFNGLEKMLVDNGSCGVFAGDKVSVADLAAWRFVGWMTCGMIDGVPRDYIPQCFPNLWQVHVNISKMPQVQQWQAAHPSNYKH